MGPGRRRRIQMRFLAVTLRSALHTLRTTRTTFPRPALIPTNRPSIFGPLSSYSASSFPNQSAALAVPSSGAFDRLTDRKFPKRRPSDKPRRKRAFLRPPGSVRFGGLSRVFFVPFISLLDLHFRCLGSFSIVVAKSSG